MFEKWNDCNKAQLEKPVMREAVLHSDQLALLEELPLVRVYAERLPDGLIEDEI